jgi:oligopeptide/dipeptide ABC transporter ATP-binding protein
VELSAVTKRFGEFVAVGDLTLDIYEGEFFSLLGPSGCGKTTILNLAAGLLTPRRGDVSFDGREISGVNTAVGYMTQDDTLLPWRTVASNIGLPLRMRKVPGDQIRQKVRSYLELLDLSHAANLFPGQLSGGMRQRVLMAVALACKPRLMIADEPTTALDVTIQQQILALVTGLQRDLGMTTIWVTHDLGVVARLVDRVVVMYAGHIVEDAPTRQLFAKPQHPYTHALLASLPNPADDSRPPLRQLTGRPPLPSERVEGCPFRPRCAQARDACAVRPVLEPRREGAAACWVPAGEWRH